MIAALHKNDFAVSFLAEDESVALELSAQLRGRLSSFVYSERQKDLVGKDGVDVFSAVFRRDSTVVVLLHRDGWGGTTWTTVEEQAIRARGFEEKNWRFLVVAKLDDTSLPLWLPPTFIWHDTPKFGPEGLAAVVEQRFKEQGHTPRSENAIELAARLKAEAEADRARWAFLASQAAVEMAEEEVRRLNGEIDRLVEACLETTSILQERRSYNTWLYRNTQTLSVHWQRPYHGSLTEAGLFTSSHHGRVGPSQYANRVKVKELAREKFSFSVDAARMPFWESALNSQRWTSIGLADYLVRQVLLFRDID